MPQWLTQILNEALFIGTITNLVRRLLTAFVTVGVFVILFLLWRGVSPQEMLSLFQRLVDVVQGRERRIDAPPDFREVMPSSWILVQTEPINIDGDPGGENDWLVIYRYDPMDRGPRGAIGGAIYDLQPDRYPANLATPRPFRPSSFIPYPLLPRPGGLGFLGESRVTAEVYDADGDPNKLELVVMGYSGYGDLVTHLSIFQWRGEPVGYGVISSTDSSVIYGDAGIEFVFRAPVTPAPGPTPTPLPLPRPDPPPIERVIVRRHLREPFYYARSRFARRIEYKWEGQPETRTLQPVANSLDFAYTRPAALEPGKLTYAVWYPEEAVLAHYQPGRVRDIILPPGTGLETTLNIVALVLSEGGEIWQVTWRATQLLDPSVKQMNQWSLEQIGGPSLP